MKKWSLLLIVLILLLIVLGELFFLWRSKKADMVRKPVPTKAPAQTVVQEYEIVGLKNSDLYYLQDSDLVNIATVGGISRNYKDTSLGDVIVGRFSKLNELGDLRLNQGDRNATVYLGTSFSFAIKEGNSVTSREVNITKVEDSEYVYKNVKVDDLIFVPQVRQDASGKFNSKTLFVIKT